MFGISVIASCFINIFSFPVSWFHNFIQRKSFYSIKYHSKSLFSLIFSYPKKENGFCWCWVTTSLFPINSITWRSKTSFKIICKSMKFWHKRCLRCYTFYINVVEVRSYVGKKTSFETAEACFSYQDLKFDKDYVVRILHK